MKLTKKEKSWLLYDIAASAFTMIISTTVPLYFAQIAETASIDGAVVTGIYGTATAIAVLILALLSPILGAIADYKGMKKTMFTISLILAIFCMISFTISNTWVLFIIFFIGARLCYAACNIFYDSMLTDVTEDERMDELSSFGYAFGYIGSCIPFIVGIVLIFINDFELIGFRLSFIVTAIWWCIFAIPLIKNVEHRHYIERDDHIVKNAFKRLRVTLGKIKTNKKFFFFIIAYFCYIDGVYTVISMATSYGAEVGIDTISLILALLVTQFVAFPCAIMSGKLGKKFGAIKLIKIFIYIYFFTCIFGFQLDKAWEFWVLAVVVGMAQGGIQALSRSYFAKQIPKEESNEYFGFFDIFGRFADFFGPLVIAFSAFVFKTSKYGILFLAVFFLVGYILLRKVEKLEDSAK